MSSCLTFSPLPRIKREAVCFLWHFPWDHSRFPLETALPCGARTFLRGIRAVRRERNWTNPRRDGRPADFRFSKSYSTRGGRFRPAVYRAPDFRRPSPVRSGRRGSPQGRCVLPSKNAHCPAAFGPA